MTRSSSRSPWLRVLPALVVSLFLLVRPRGSSFDELRFALCLSPWLIASGLPLVRLPLIRAGGTLRGALCDSAVLAQVALAVPILGLALSTTPGIHSKWLLLYGAALIFILGLAAERAARGSRRERIAHAVGWLALIPLPLALTFAASFSNSPERTVLVKKWGALTPPAIVVADALRSSPPAFPSLSKRERQVLAQHGAFEKLFERDLAAGQNTAEGSESRSNSRLWEIFRDLIPAVISSLVLLGLSCCGGHRRDFEGRSA